MKKIPISQVDALFADGSYPIEFLFIYNEAFPTKKLRNALRILSSPFYPLFSTYRGGEILFEKYEEENHFMEESRDRDLDLSEFETSSPEWISRYSVKERKHLFFLKAIRYRNGLILVPKMDHLAGDGYSYFYFLSVLASLTHSALPPLKSLFLTAVVKPRHQRTILREFCLTDINRGPFRPDTDFTIEHRQIPCREVQAHITSALKQGNRVSSNDILAATVTKRLLEVNPGFWGKEIELTIPIDVRRQLKEYGRRFFGNSLMLHTLKLDREQFRESSLEKSAAQIRTSLPTITRQVYISYLEHLEKLISEKQWERFRPFDPRRGCLVTNLSRLPADRLDFGSGPPARIIPLTVEKNSAGILRTEEDYVMRLVH
jgi:hypothetical protein